VGLGGLLFKEAAQVAEEGFQHDQPHRLDLAAIPQRQRTDGWFEAVQRAWEDQLVELAARKAGPSAKRAGLWQADELRGDRCLVVGLDRSCRRCVKLHAINSENAAGILTVSS